MNRFGTAAATLAGGLLCVSCGGGDTFSKEDAGAAQQAAVTAITQAVSASATNTLRAQQANGNISVDYTWDCMSGGTVQVVGEWSGSSSGAGSASVYYDVEAQFSGCNDGTVTMDGNLSYVTGINASGGSASFQLVMDGTITYSGAFSGECVFDVNISGSANGAGAGSGSASGSICGQDFNGSF